MQASNLGSAAGTPIGRLAPRIRKVPKINFLSEDDARAIVPPTEEQYQALICGAEQLRPIAPLLPEVVELLGEFGLRPGELFHHAPRPGDPGGAPRQGVPQSGRAGDPQRPRAALHPPWTKGP
jgi:hypothetical protein